MIKQSFLRNYDISRIYTEADVQKKRLFVLYARQLSKTLKDKHLDDRIQLQAKREKENRQEKELIHQKIREMELEKEQKHRDILKRVKTSKLANRRFVKTEDNFYKQDKTQLFIKNISANVKENTISNGFFIHRKVNPKILLHRQANSHLTSVQTTTQTDSQNPNFSNKKLLTSHSFYQNLQLIHNKEENEKPKIKKVPLTKAAKTNQTTKRLLTQNSQQYLTRKYRMEEESLHIEQIIPEFSSKGIKSQQFARKKKEMITEF